jgi:signal transduction histidine kinase
LNAVADRLREREPVLADMLDRARGTLLNTVELKRRIVEDLRPSMLDNLGLSMSLQSYCGDFARVTGVDCEALIEGDIDVVGPMQSIAVFRIVQESLNNIAKYAQARQVIVHVAREGQHLSLEINDDGVGIDPDELATPKSHGLLGMRERALLLGGTLRVKRGVNNRGTTVEAMIPVGEGEAPLKQNGQPERLPEDSINALHPSAGDRTPSSRPYSIRRHIPQGLDG